MSLTLAALWSIGLLVAYLLLHQPRFWAQPPPRYAGAVILIVALIARLVPNLLVGAGDNYDMESYKLVGQIVLNGEDVYSATAGANRYPYLPFLLYWLAAAVRVSKISGWDFAAVVRILPSVADIALAVLIYLLLKSKLDKRDGWHAGLLYSLNPVVVFVSAYHGQFDSMTSLLMIASAASLSFTSISGSLLGLSILIKSWSVLAYPSLIINIRSRCKRIIYTLLMVMVPVGGIALYAWLFKANPLMVFSQAVSYNRGVGIWGYPFFLRILIEKLLELPKLYAAFIPAARLLTLLAVGLVWWFRARFEQPFHSLLLIFVAFFTFTHAFAIQYLMWLVPLGLLNADYRWTRRFTIMAFVYMFVVYFTVILRFQIGDYLPWSIANNYLIIPLSLPVWMICIAWLVDLWKRPTSAVV